METKELKEQRDKLSKQYLDLYARVEEAKQLIKELITKNKFKIENDDYIFIFLEQLGDLKQILNILEKKNE